MVHKPSKLRILCSDHRLDTLNMQLGDAVRIRLPGGPRIISDPESREFGLKKVLRLHGKYHFREIEVIYHGQGCADYAADGHTFPDADAEMLFYQNEGAITLNELKAQPDLEGVTISLWYAHKEADGQFTELFPLDESVQPMDSTITQLMFPRTAGATQ